jgi:hypothetical protein
MVIIGRMTRALRRRAGPCRSSADRAHLLRINEAPPADADPRGRPSEV